MYTVSRLGVSLSPSSGVAICDLVLGALMTRVACHLASPRRWVNLTPHRWLVLALPLTQQTFPLPRTSLGAPSVLVPWLAIAARLRV